MLAIGYINGSVQVLHLEQGFAMKANKKDRKEAISEIKFSPDDSILAVGAHDSLIITYDARNNFALLRRIRKNLSTVSHFDFSLDGQFLVSNSTSYEILYFDV
jgi:WD40 repeat protein